MYSPNRPKKLYQPPNMTRPAPCSTRPATCSIATAREPGRRVVAHHVERVRLLKERRRRRLLAGHVVERQAMVQHDPGQIAGSALEAVVAQIADLRKHQDVLVKSRWYCPGK